MQNSYPSLNLSYTSQKSSYLYSLSPLYVGTAKVESLTGYITRLSEAHCVYPGILLERILAPIIQKKCGSATLHKIYNYTGTLNGTGVMASDLITAIEKLTEQENLSKLTLMQWSDILPSRYLLHRYRTWCPFCYENWYQQKHPIYEPLIWTLKLIKICPIHQIPLQNKCHHCHKNNFLLSWKSRSGYCSCCQKWLGYSQLNLINQSFSSNTLDWHIWVAKNLEDLLSLNLDLFVINISRSLNKIADEFTEGNIAALSRLLQMPKNTVWLWCKGKNKPSLESLLILCYRLKINLVDLLTERTFCLSKDKTLPMSSAIISVPRKQPTFDALKVQWELLEIINSQEIPPPSLEEVARQISADSRTIYEHFPELCHQISSRYLNYQNIRHGEKINQCCQEIEQAIRSLMGKGIYPTEKRIYPLLSHPGYIRYKEVRQFFKDTRKLLLNFHV